MVLEWGKTGHPVDDMYSSTWGGNRNCTIREQLCIWFDDLLKCDDCIYIVIFFVMLLFLYSISYSQIRHFLYIDIPWLFPLRGVAVIKEESLEALRPSTLHLLWLTGEVLLGEGVPRPLTQTWQCSSVFPYRALLIPTIWNAARHLCAHFFRGNRDEW